MATLGYGLMPIFTLIAYKANTSPSELVILRFFGAALFMWIFFLCTRGIKKLTGYPIKTIFRIVISIGIPFTLAILTKFVAFTTMPVGVVQAIFYGYPLIVMLIGVTTGKEAFYPSRLVGYTIILFGVLLTLDFADTRLTTMGVLLSVASTIIYSWYILSIRNPKILPIPSPVITTYAMSTGTVLMLVAFPFFPNNGFSFAPQAWWGIAGLVFISSIGGFLAFNHGAKHIDSSLAAIICCFEPIVTIVFEMLFLKGHYTDRQLIGIVIIPMGIILSLVLSRKPRKRPTMS